MRIDYRAESDRTEKSFCGTMDLKRMDFSIADKSAAVFYIDGMLDKELFERNILTPLKTTQSLEQPYPEALNKITFTSEAINVLEDFEEFTQAIAAGDLGMIIDEAEQYFIFSVRKYEIRSIAEPPVNSVLHGPREGFNEDLKVNLTMIRRRLRTPNLVVDMLKVGQYSQTNIALIHIDGVASPETVKMIKEKIKKIEIDGVVDSSYIARFLEEKKNSIFRQIGINEKPDIVTAKMLEGRVAIVVDGSPIVLTAPFVVLENYQAAEDYYVKSPRATLTRSIRMLAQFIAILMPGLYVAFQEYQYDILPLKFMTVIMNNIFGLPFSPLLEMLLVLIFFEILNEASIKMPKYVGMALSIVGAIVLGETAVNAGLVSTPAVLVLALSTLGIYCVPDGADSAGIMRLGFVVLAGALGIFGIVLGILFIMAYLTTIDSFGTTLLAPIAPLLPHDFEDIFMKNDITEENERPDTIPNVNKTKMVKEDEKNEK